MHGAAAWLSLGLRLAAGSVPRPYAAPPRATPGRRRHLRTCGPPQLSPGSRAGRSSWLSPPSVPTRPHSSSCRLPPSSARDPYQSCTRSWPTLAATSSRQKVANCRRSWDSSRSRKKAREKKKLSRERCPRAVSSKRHPWFQVFDLFPFAARCRLYHKRSWHTARMFSCKYITVLHCTHLLRSGRPGLTFVYGTHRLSIPWCKHVQTLDDCSALAWPLVSDLAQASDALAEAGALHPPLTMPTPVSPIGAGNALLLASSTIMPWPSTATTSGLQSSHSSIQSRPSTLRALPGLRCCHLPLRDAAVAVRLMPWVTTSLPALGLVFSGRGVVRSNEQLLGSAREAGAAVAPRVLVRDLNLQASRHHSAESRQSPMVCWGGSQLAVDSALVSLLTFAGVPRHRRGTPGHRACLP